MFGRGVILTLSDENEYCVIDEFNEDGVDYIYLVDINNNANILFCKMIGDSFCEIADPEELDKVILKFSNHLRNKDVLEEINKLLMDNEYRE